MQSTMSAAVGSRVRGLRLERKFFTMTSLVMVAVVAVGFAPSFYLRGIVPAPHPFERLVPLVVLHGILFTGFLLLFVTQVHLIAAGRQDIHRKVGRAAYVLLPLMIVVAFLTGLEGVARPLTAPPGISPLSWLAVPILDVPVFGTLLTLGLKNRMQPDLHKRYMYISMVDMLAPALGRLPLPLAPSTMVLTGQVILPAAFLLALVALDIRLIGRPHRVTLIAGTAVIVVAALKPYIWATAEWLHFAQSISASLR